MSVVIMVSMLAAIANLHKLRVGETPKDPPYNFILRRISDFDTSTVILLSLPFMLGVGFYAWCVSVLSRRAIDFERSITLSAYFVGTVAFLYTCLVPAFAILTRVGEEPPFGQWLRPYLFQLWLALGGILPWCFVLVCAYRYMHLLRRETGRSRLSTAGTCSAATAIFLVAFYAMLWNVLAVMPQR